MTIRGMRRVVGEVRAIRERYRIPYSVIWREYVRFRDASGMSRGEFLRYRLWDTRNSVAQRMAVISSRERIAAEPFINLPAPSLQVRDKAWATDVLTRAGLPTTPVLGLLALEQHTELDSQHKPTHVGKAGLVRLLAEAPTDGFVIKPNRGGGGASVYVFSHASPDGLTALDGTYWTVPQLLQALTTDPLWKIERRLVQHPDLARVSGPTVGTLRLVTFRLRDGSIHLGPPVWKIAVGNSGVDHYMHGAGQFAAPIDPATGTIGPARRWIEFEPVDNHPVTGQRITGIKIPHWQAAADLAIRATDCFPDLGSPAWDIAITPTGPVVIETNVYWSQELTQSPGPRGVVAGPFRQFLEERGCGGVVNLAARDRTLDE